MLTIRRETFNALILSFYQEADNDECKMIVLGLNHRLNEVNRIYGCAVAGAQLYEEVERQVCATFGEPYMKYGGQLAA